MKFTIDEIIERWRTPDLAWKNGSLFKYFILTYILMGRNDGTKNENFLFKIINVQNLIFTILYFEMNKKDWL